MTPRADLHTRPVDANDLVDVLRKARRLANSISHELWSLEQDVQTSSKRVYGYQEEAARQAANQLRDVAAALGIEQGERA